MPDKRKKPHVDADSSSATFDRIGFRRGDSRGDFWVLPDGRTISIDDADSVFTFLAGAEENQETLKRILLGLARCCGESARHEAAVAYFEKVLTLEDDPEQRCRCFLTMGQLLENSGNFPAAAAAYSRAFEMPAQADDTWYWLNNNLGYSLNRVGRHAEAEGYCRAAIAIDPTRYNADKNLGLSLQGQDRHLEAALCFLEATRLEPNDSRALDHLEELLARHGEIGRDRPEILETAQLCREAVCTQEGQRMM